MRFFTAKFFATYWLQASRLAASHIGSECKDHNGRVVEGNAPKLINEFSTLSLNHHALRKNGTSSAISTLRLALDLVVSIFTGFSLFTFSSPSN
jgi:hypothetical protein